MDVMNSVTENNTPRVCAGLDKQGTITSHYYYAASGCMHNNYIYAANGYGALEVPSELLRS